MKIAILDALPKIYWPDDGGYTDGEKFRDMLSPCIPEAEFEIFYVAENETPDDIRRFDGIVSSGSSASVHDREPWIDKLRSLLTEANGQKIKIIGICFSHQLIADMLGGEVIKNEQGWLIGNYRLLIDKQHSWMQTGQETTRVHHFNQERVSRLPSEAKAFARSDLYDNFAYTIDEHILCIQGHPEQPNRSINNWLKSMEHDLPEEELALARIMTATGEPDNRLWANWFSEFLRR